MSRTNDTRHRRSGRGAAQARRTGSFTSATLVIVIVVVEGPSAAGKTTWCRDDASTWLAEPGRWPMEEILRYQIERWRKAVAADARGEIVVLDGDPFKLYYSWASWRVGHITDEQWSEALEAARHQFVEGNYGLADLILYADPGLEELRRRRDADATRLRRNFELHTSMRPHFRAWYESVAALDRHRVVWEHPDGGLTDELLAIGRRPERSDPRLFEKLLAHLEAEPGATGPAIPPR